MTAFQTEGCGRLSAAGCVSLRSGGDSPDGLRVAVAPYRAMLIKSALRDLLSVSYGIVSILVISRCAAPPYPAAPDFPPKGETTHYDLCVAGAPSNHVRCASLRSGGDSACGAEGCGLPLCGNAYKVSVMREGS